MPSVMPSSVCADGSPRQTRKSGSASSIWRRMKGRQICRLLRRRSAIAGRPPGHDVGDVDLAAVEPDGGEHQVEQFARAADERQALDVLVAAGRFADEHQPWPADCRRRTRVAWRSPSARSRRSRRGWRAALRGCWRFWPPRAPPWRRRPGGRRAAPKAARRGLWSRGRAAARPSWGARTGGGTSGAAKRSTGCSPKSASTPASR